MMLNRRMLVAAIAAVPTFFASLRAEAAKIDELSRARIPAFNHPRGALSYSAGPISEPISISTGREWVLIESPAGQGVLNEMAVNLRSDGTMRHRQHHPTDFPPRSR